MGRGHLEWRGAGQDHPCPGLNPSFPAGWTVLLAKMDYAKSLSLRLAAPVSK